MLSHIRRPGFIEPCLPSPGEQPPTGPGWLHEIKHDGYRLMARRDGAWRAAANPPFPQVFCDHRKAPVTRIAIVAITLGILTTATAIGSASAAEMPKELRGIWWCADRPGWSPRTHSPWPAGNYRRCRLPVTDAQDAFEIGASGWNHDMTDETCEVLRVTSYGKGYFIVRARCNNGEKSNVLHRWRLLNSGRRLEIRDATIEASAADAWQKDFRRCRVLKQFPQGEVVISAAGEKMVELDVHWSDGADLDKVGAEDISVRIDNVPVPHPKPLRSTVGMLYGFELGSFNAIFPALSRGKRLQISFPDKPEHTVDLDIGAGGKAVAFLKKCAG